MQDKHTYLFHFPKKYFSFFSINLYFAASTLLKMDTPVTESTSIIDQIKTALDGRPQRWLSEKIEMNEGLLSLKMNGKSNFTLPELQAISRELKCTLQIEAGDE